MKILIRVHIFLETIGSGLLLSRSFSGRCFLVIKLLPEMDLAVTATT